MHKRRISLDKSRTSNSGRPRAQAARISSRSKIVVAFILVPPQSLSPFASVSEVLHKGNYACADLGDYAKRWPNPFFSLASDSV